MSLTVKLLRFKILKCKSEKYARFEFRGSTKFTPLPHQQDDYLIVNKRFEWMITEPVCPGEVLVLHLLSRSRWGSQVIVGVYRLGLQILVNDGQLFVTDSLVDENNKPVMIQFILAVTNMYYQQKLAPCPIPGFFYYYGMTVTCSFFVLFLKFYINRYLTQ